MKNNYSFCSLLRFLPLSNTVSLSIILLVALLPFAFPLHSYADVDYFYFQAEEASAPIFINRVGIPTKDFTFQISTDNGVSWTSKTISSGTSGVTICTLANVGDKVLMRGKNNTSKGIGSTNDGSYKAFKFVITGKNVSVGGNIMTLIDYESEVTEIPNTYCFNNFFKGSTKLISAEHLRLPATTLKNGCYECMFDGCTNLVTPPSELPATTLANNCYNQMFAGCNKLASVPDMPATTLAEGCYLKMFWKCFALTSAPALPVTTLQTQCYNMMFANCTALTTAPELPATTLAASCYINMFSGCTALTAAPELPATTLATDCYNGMFNGCTALTTAPSELPATNLVARCYKQMFQGCTSLVNAPAIMATSLPNNNTANAGCMEYMFKNCSSLSRLEVHFSAWDNNAYDDSRSATYFWLDGTSTSSSCQFICPCDLPDVNRGVHRIKDGWTLNRSYAYTFNVEDNEGTWDGSDDTDKIVETIGGPFTVSSSFAPEKENCVFLGWNTAADGSGTTITSDNQSTFQSCSAEENTFYALFAPQLTFYVNGGSWDLEGSDTDPRVVTAPVVSLTDPQRTSYNFIGWNTREDGLGVDFDIDNQPSSPTTYYAQWEFAAIDLADNIDNTETLNGHIGDVVTVTLAGRTLVGNTTNTICLPFSMTAEQIDDSPLAGSTIWQFNSASCADETLTVSVSETSAITAGNPYLIVPVADIVEPTFANVTISTTSGNSIGNGEVSFQGIQVPTPLTAGNQNQLFLTAGNILQHPSTNGNLKAYRAYFLLSEGTPASVMPRARVAFNRGPQMPTGIPSSLITDKPVKLIQDGQLLILRSGKTYTAQGQILIDN